MTSLDSGNRRSILIDFLTKREYPTGWFSEQHSVELVEECLFRAHCPDNEERDFYVLQECELERLGFFPEIFAEHDALGHRVQIIESIEYDQARTEFMMIQSSRK